MTPIKGLIKSVAADYRHTAEQPMQQFQDGHLKLELKRRFLYSDHESPGFEFNVISGGDAAGTCTALIESDFQKIDDVGNVGVELEEKFCGKGIAPKVIKMLYPYFRSYGQQKLLFSCPEYHRAILRVCEKLGAQPTAEAGDGKRRFTVGLE